MLLQPESLLSNNDSLEGEVASLRNQLQLRDEQNKILMEENARLQEMLLELKRYRFSKRSERWQSEEQLLFNEIEIESQKLDSDEDDSETEIEVKAHKKKRGKRKLLPDHLAREIVKVELPVEEQFAPILEAT